MPTKKLQRRMFVCAVLAGGLIFIVGDTGHANQNCVNDCQDQLASGQTGQQPAQQAQIPVLATLVAEPMAVNANVNAEPISGPPLSAGAPLSLAIVVETSSRVDPFLTAIRRTGILLTGDVLGPDSEAALVGYNDEVDRLLDFTSDDEAIEKAVSEIRMGTSGAHLYDALSQAVDLLHTRSSSRRRVIVVLAEATDTGSEEDLSRVIHEAHLNHITIYCVALSSTAAELGAPPEQAAPPSATPSGIFGMPPIPGTPQEPTTEALRSGNMNLGALVMLGAKNATAPLREDPLKVAAESTDGLYVSTFRNSSIQQAIDRIGVELHAQN